MKIKMIVLFFVIPIMAVVPFVYLNGRNQIDHMQCVSNYKLFANDTILKLSLDYTFEYGSGFVSIKGKEFRNNDIISNISLKKSFKYKSSGHGFIFYNDETTYLEDESSASASIKKLLPKFYSSNEKEHSMLLKIKKVDANNFMFMTSVTPYFLCEKVESE